MEGETRERIRLTSPGIHGDGDVDRVETVLGAVQGVTSVTVDPSTHTVEVTYDPRVVDENGIREALQDDGYQTEG